MFKGLSILFACLLCSVAHAYEPWELNLVIEYTYSNYNANAPLNFALQADEKGLTLGHWSLPVAKPTMTQLNALADAKLAEAKAWRAAKTATETGDIEKMDRQVKMWFRALVKLHNEKCPSGERFNMDELKAKVEELATREK